MVNQVNLVQLGNIIKYAKEGRWREILKFESRTEREMKQSNEDIFSDIALL